MKNKIIINITIQKYKFKRLLTKDPSKTSILEYIIIRIYTVQYNSLIKKGYCIIC